MQPDVFSTQPAVPASSSGSSQNSGQPVSTRSSGASIVALVAGLIAILAFFALPYYRIGTRLGFAITPAGRDLAGGPESLPALGQHPIFWIVLLASLVALVFSLLPLFVRAISERLQGIIFLATGILGVIALLLGLLSVRADLHRIVGRRALPPEIAASAVLSGSTGIGFWLTALALIALVVAGALALSRRA
jgi:hypothetical protein